MKNNIIYCILILSLFSCKKDDKPVFDKSPDERLNEKLAAYQAQLSGAQNGWKAILRVDSGKGPVFSFYFKFTDSNRVKMLSDFDSLSAVTLTESSYRLKALQQPSLIFDTYSYLHVLSDPFEGVNGGVRGAGLSSDFEFYFDSTTTDSVKLVGRIHGTKMTLVRATKAEEDAYNSGALAAGLYVNKILTYFKRLTIGSQLYDVQIDPVNRLFTFSWLDANGNLRTFSTGYYFIAGGIVFTTPLVNGSQTVSGFSNLVWNQATETITLTANGGVAATINGIVVPLRVDIGAPAKWWNYSVSQDSYWATANGFHINGVDDAFKWSDVPGYGFTLFWARYGTSGGINYDLLAPIINNSLSFGAAYRPPTFTTDGRIIFRILGTLGTVPANVASNYLNLRTKMSEPGGWYFVQVDQDGLVFDMVSATDGKAWVRWEW